MTDKEEKEIVVEEEKTEEEERKTLLHERSLHKTFREGIKASFLGQQAAMDKAFPPIVDNMKVHIVYDEIERKIGHTLPAEAIMSGGRRLEHSSYVLMRAVKNPPKGHLVLIRGEKYIITSIVGYISPSDMLIPQIARKLKAEEEHIRGILKSIFSKSQHIRDVFNWGHSAYKVIDAICKDQNNSVDSARTIIKALNDNLIRRSMHYDLTSGYAIQAIISENKIYPLLRPALGSERVATRKKIRRDHMIPSLEGQRTEVWPVIKPIYTEMVNLKPNINKSEEEPEELTEEENEGIDNDETSADWNDN